MSRFATASFVMPGEAVAEVIDLTGDEGEKHFVRTRRIPGPFSSRPTAPEYTNERLRDRRRCLTERIRQDERPRQDVCQLCDRPFSRATFRRNEYGYCGPCNDVRMMSIDDSKTKKSELGKRYAFYREARDTLKDAEVRSEDSDEENSDDRDFIVPDDVDEMEL